MNAPFNRPGRCLVGLLLLCFGFTAQVLAQGTAQVQLLNVPAVLPSPSVAQLIRDYEQGRYPVQFIYTNSLADPVLFSFRVRLEKDGVPVLELTSEPVAFTPGVYTYVTFEEAPRIRFGGGQEVLDQLDPDLQEIVIRSGWLPEGLYTITIEVLTEESTVTAFPAMANVRVQYAQPPVLVTPADGATVTPVTPVFSWLPVLAPPGTQVVYDLLVVEVFPEQTPLQAIEGNRAHAEATLTQTTLVYTPDLLPLEPGHTYAWQVRAREVNGLLPFSEDGYSEIYTFTVGEQTGIEGSEPFALERLVLEPGFATLLGLEGLTVTEEPSAYVLDGQAQLELTFEQGTVSVQVGVQGLRIQKPMFEPPVVLGGTLQGSLAQVDVPIKGLDRTRLRLADLTWELGTGFEAAVRLQFAGGQADMDGRVRLMPGGAAGTVTLTGNPVGTLGGPPLAVDVNRLELRFPDLTFRATGQVRLFDEPIPCNINPLLLSDELLYGRVSCQVDRSIPLVGGFDGVTLHVQEVVGEFGGSREEEALAGYLETLLRNRPGLRSEVGEAGGTSSNTFPYEVTATGSLRIQGREGPRCDVALGLHLSHTDGLQVAEFRPACAMDPRWRLGLGVLQLHNFREWKLAYHPETGWDFQLTMDVDLGLELDTDDPEHGTLALPTIEGVRLRRGGLSFPEITFEEADLAVLPPLRLGGFRLRPLRFQLPPQEITWEDWPEDAEAPREPGSWSWTWDFRVEFDQEADTSGSEMPACLRQAALFVRGANFSDGRLSATVPVTVIQPPGCIIPFRAGFLPGEDYAFTIQELGGTFSGTAGPDGFAYDGQITARGFLSAGAPFTCADQEAGQPGPTTRGAGAGRARLGPQALTPLVATALTLHSNGRLVGEVTGLTPDCPITIGPFTVQVQNVALRFATGPGGQEAWLGGTAVVHYTGTDGQQLSASGQIGIDLVRPAIDTFHVVLQGPFVWGLPAESPVLSFQLNRAELDRLGLLIDGQQTFVLGDGATRTVRFDALRLDWATGRIRSGAILFDEAFGLEVGIDTLTGELGYRAVNPETPLTMNPGLRFDLTGSVRLDSLGLFVTGEADARLHYAGQIHDSLRVAYADGFRLRFDPPRVYTGRADFFWGTTRIAWLDADGFHPDPNVFQLLIPERVPLPVESVAYLVIKRDGNLLLDVTRLDDGSIRLDTRPGQPLELVVPALQGSQPAPPSLQVQLTDVRFDAFWQWRSGEIHATVPPGDPAFDLHSLGLPLSLQALGFGAVSLGAMETRGFYLKGNLLLFEQEISASAPVTALVRTDRTVYVAAELSGLDAPIALVEGESAVRWHLQRVAGWWDGPLASPGTATYRFELEGAFRLYDANDQVVAQAATQAWFEPAGLTLIGFQSDTSVAPMASLEAGPFYLQVDRLRSLLLTYTSQQGFDFFVDLDLRLGFVGEDWQFGMPLRGVTLRPDGFRLPAQEVHQHSDPPLIADPIPVGDFQIRPLAVRIPEVQVTWGNFDGRRVLDFLPHFDLELTLPGYAVTAPDLASVTLTLSDIGFAEGILTGTIEPYTFPAPGARLLLGPPAADPPTLYIEQVAGGLVRVETASGPQQGLDLTVQGYLAALPYVEDTTGCAPVAFQLHLTGRGIEGTLGDFQTCGAIPFGPLALSLEQGSVTFAFQEGRQEAIARGTGRLRIPAPGANTTPVEVQGSIGLDLITGRLLEGTIELAQPFRWALPSFEQPLFELTVQQGRFDSDGLWLLGGAELMLADGTGLAVVLEDLQLDPAASFAVASGRLRITGALAFEVAFQQPVSWQLVAFDAPLTAPDVFRMRAAGQLVLDQNGIALSGQAAGALYLTPPEGGEPAPYPTLTVDYVEDFRLGLVYDPTAPVPIQILQGRADFLLDGVRLAWLDTGGFHLDYAGLGWTVAELAIPDRLGLPTEDVAYLQLRDPNTRELLVTLTQGDAGTWQLSTDSQPVMLVLAGFDGAPAVAVTFALVVDDGLNVVDGQLAVNLENAPLDMEPFTGLPLTLTELVYERGSPYRLLARGQIRLPEALQGLTVQIDSLTFSEQGFGQASFSVGTLPEMDDPALEPAWEQTFAEGFAVQVLGARIAFGDQQAIELAGRFTSPLLVDDEAQPQALFYRMHYDPVQNGWIVQLTGIPEVSIGLGRFELGPVGQHPALEAQLTDQWLRLTLSGRLSMPEVLGEDFAVSIGGLRLGTDGIDVGEVDLTGTPEISLLDELLQIELTELTPAYENEVYRLTLSGTGRLAYMDEQAAGFSVQDLQVGTDGSFQIGSGALNLLAEGELAVVPDLITLTELQLGLNNGRLTMTVGGRLDTPAPVEGSGMVSGTIALSESGTVETARIEALLEFDPALNGSAPAVAVGDLGTLKPTGIGAEIDLRDMAGTAYYAGAVLYVENNEQKVIWLGEAGNLSQRPGIRYRHEEGLTWHLTSTASPEHPLFDFDYGFFELEIHALSTFDPQVFGLELGGALGLAVAGLEGRVGYSGFRLAMPDAQHPSPVRQWPEFRGGRFTLMGITSLELGTFEVGAATTLQLTQGSDPENIETIEIPVQSYLRFANSQGSAVRISLGDALAGGVEEVLVYRDTGGTLFLYVKNAALDLAGVGRLSASMRYLQGPAGFSLLMAGDGNLAGLGSIAAAGKFAVLNDRLSMGVFIAVQTEAAIPLIPAAPPVLGLTGVGGGIFLRPEAADLEAVQDAVAAMDPALGFMLEQRGLPPTDAGFAVMAYASFVMLGQGPINVKEGSIFLELTDRYINLTASGSYLKQEQKLVGGFSATLTWAPQLRIDGLIAAQANYAPAFSGAGELGFSVAIPGQGQQIVWVIDGELEGSVVGLTVSGSLVVSPAGLFTELQVSQSISVVVVRLEGSFTTRIWLIPDPDNPLDTELGSFASLYVSAEVFGARAYGEARGLFLIRNQQVSLYTLAVLGVEIPYVGPAQVGAFLSFREGQVEAGILNEVDGAFAAMLAEAEAAADAVQAQAESARAAAEAVRDAFDPSLSDEVLAAAGLRTQQMSQFYLGNLALLLSYGLAGQYEQYLLDPLPDAWTWVAQQVVFADDRPDRGPVEAAETAMETALAEANTHADEAVQALGALQRQAIEWQVTGTQALEALDTPLTVGPTPHTTTGDDGFSYTSTAPFGVDVAAAAAQQDRARAAASIQMDFTEREAAYREAIADVEANLQELDDRIAEGNLVAQGERFAIAREAVDEFFAQEANYYWQVERWARTRRSALQSQHDAILAGVTAAVNRYKTMPLSSANAALQQIGSSPCTGFSINDSRRLLAAAVAAKRREVLLLLAGNYSEDALDDFVDGLCQQAADNPSGFETSFRTTAEEFWYDQHELGLAAYRDLAETQARAVWNDREAHIAPLTASHAQYSQALDSLLLARARLTEALYGLIDTYLAARSRAGLSLSTADVQLYVQRRAELARMLEPPVISGITVQTERLSETHTTTVDGTGGIGRGGVVGARAVGIAPIVATYHRPAFMSRAQIQWQATHPDGLGPAAVRIQSGAAVVAQDSLFSVGTRATFTQWRFRRGNVSDLLNRSYTVTVQVRGPAGYGTSRTASYVLPAVYSQSDPEDWVAGSGSSTTTFGENADPTPPELLRVASAPWSQDRTRLSLTLEARDLESGIRRFEVAIGTSPGGEQVHAWTPVSGVREERGGTVQLQVTLRDLTLQPGPSVNYVQIRAQNGVKQYSTVSTVQVRVDETPPLWTQRPAILAARSMSGRSSLTANVGSRLVSTSPVPTVLQPPTLGPFTWRSPRVNMPEPVGSPPAMTVRWRARDDESNVVGYSVQVGSESTISFDVLAQTDRQTAAQQAVTPPNYRDSVYVHVVAWNGAGLAGPVERLGLLAADPTPPAVPAVAVVPYPDHLRVFLTQLSGDPESGLIGYQWAAGRAPTDEGFRSWPAPDRPDLPVTMLERADERPRPPFFEIPRSALPRTGPFYLKLRAVNGQGMPSAPVIVGPLAFDDTPPLVSAFTVERKGRSLRVGVTGVQDPESGIYTVTAELRDGLTDRVLGTTLLFQQPGNPFTQGDPVTVEGVLSLPEHMHSVRVQLAVRNGIGHTAQFQSDPVVVDEAALAVTPAPTRVLALQTGPVRSGRIPVRITWEMPDYPYVARYRVERSGPQGFVTIGAVQAPPFDDVQGTSDARYRVVAINMNEVESVPTEAVAVTTPPTPPAPTNLTVSWTASGVVQLVWTPSTDDFDYVVERAPAESEAFTAVATVETPRFIDQDGQGGMRYRVRARNVSAVAGPASAAVTVPLPAPTGVSASMEHLTGDVRLQWQPVSGAVSYEIYRDDTRRGTFARIGETSNPAFVDRRGSSGSRYYVIARDASGRKSPPSEVVPVSVRMRISVPLLGR